MTLSDRPSKLFREGKFAKVPVMRKNWFLLGSADTESWQQPLLQTRFRCFSRTRLRIGLFSSVPLWDQRLLRILSTPLQSIFFLIHDQPPASSSPFVVSLYPEPLGFQNASYDTGTYPDFAHRVWALFQDSLAGCASPMIARAASQHDVPVYEARFNAPQPGFPSWDGTTHSRFDFSPSFVIQVRYRRS